MEREMTPEQAELVEKNFKLVYKFLSKFKDNKEDRDDLLSDASLGLCKAAMSFDPGKGCTFSTYAYVCMMNACRGGRRDRRRQTALDPISLDGEVNVDDDTGIRIENLAGVEDDTSAIEISADIEQFLDTMSTFDLRILSLLMQGSKQAEIAKDLGCSRAYISARVVNLRRAYAEGRRPRASARQRDPEQDALLRQEIMNLAGIK